jgi:cyclomaltodextrinase / maltogenic alpha-amylase / neopullulanase
MSRWASDACIYNLYPLGAVGAPARNDLHAPVSQRIEQLYAWLSHVQAVGADALLLGPVFESTAHGYDTADFFRIDRRLGTNEEFARWSKTLHQHGLRLVLDGVFHHVGRKFWAFRDVLAHGQGSAYCHWFHLDFTRRSPHGDPFFYEGWNGHYDLVKLRVDHPDVKEHLFAAVRTWIEEFGIDGLRLDAADALDLGFQKELAAFCRALRPDFWIMAEVIHGDYRRWISEGAVDSVTNYELHKGLYSSHNDRNLFEIAHSLNRQFGQGGLYEGLSLYNFADNHDVERIASRLREPDHLYPLHILLFTVPGIPSIYYGSEVGLEGRKGAGTDAPLRPALTSSDLRRRGAHPDLLPVIQRLAVLRKQRIALRRGSYRQLHVTPEQIAFLREAGEDRIAVAVNAAGAPAQIRISISGARWLVDVLNPGHTFEVHKGVAVVPLDAHWGRVLVSER